MTTNQLQVSPKEWRMGFREVAASTLVAFALFSSACQKPGTTQERMPPAAANAQERQAVEREPSRADHASAPAPDVEKASVPLSGTIKTSPQNQADVQAMAPRTGREPTGKIPESLRALDEKPRTPQAPRTMPAVTEPPAATENPAAELPVQNKAPAPVTPPRLSRKALDPKARAERQAECIKAGTFDTPAPYYCNCDVGELGTRECNYKDPH